MIAVNLDYIPKINKPNSGIRISLNYPQHIINRFDKEKLTGLLKVE